VIGALALPAHAHQSAERAVAAVAPGPCAVTGPQRLCTARTAGAQASARQLKGPARSTQTNRQRSVRPRAVLTACCGPVCSQVHDGGLAHPFTGASRTSSSSSRLTSTAGSSRGGASRRGRSAWVGLAHVDSHHDVPGRARSRPLVRTRLAPSQHGRPRAQPLLP